MARRHPSVPCPRSLPLRVGPFLKWAGGKAQLLAAYDPHLLKVPLAGYIEPFVGGGALFFYFTRRYPDLLPPPPGRTVLADRNPDLIAGYQVVRDAVEELIEELGKREGAFNGLSTQAARRALYERVRTERPASPAARAARFIFLNRTCYNGLWRVNGKGEFNVPMGRYRSPRILDPENLRSASAALDGACLECGDFEEVTRRHARPGWFVYFDPPYVPLSPTAGFTGYTAERFTLSDQERLARLFADLDEAGCCCLLSNSSHALTERFYRAYRPITIPARRAINSRSDRRGEIAEYLILGNTLRRLVGGS